MSSHDASTVTSWSGIPYHMARAFAGNGVSLEYISPLRRTINPVALGVGLLNRGLGRRYLFDLDPSVGRAYARQISRRLASLTVDAIVGVGAIPIAYLETELPLVYWTDATFDALCGYYPEFTGLSDANVRGGNAMEHAALAHADTAYFSSAWAADSALNAYRAPPDKVRVLAFGANLSKEPDRCEVEALISARPRQECRLFFLGVDWRRKGGDLALAVASNLAAQGIPTRLAVVGPRRSDVPESDLIDYHGFIDKSTPSGEARIARLLGESHFLCLPSHAECNAIAFCEAAAYGVPTLSCRTGGIESAVRDNRNGYLFDERSFIDSAAAAIVACMASYEARYVPLAKASHEEFRSRLNWATSTRILLDDVSRLVAARS